jgi:hypothetical protein
MRPVLRLLLLAAVIPLGCKNAVPAAEVPPSPAKQRVALVQAIQRADYQGDRPALARLHQELSALPEDPATAARQRYWEGFALWRRAINGNNQKPPPEDLRTDLVQAVADFERSLQADPTFDDSSVGRISCLQFLAVLDGPEKSKPTVDRFVALFKELAPRAGDNPRFLWIRGLGEWWTPPGSTPEVVEQRHARSMATYAQGAELARQQKARVTDPLTPSWGEPENLMSLAWCSLNQSTPDAARAEAYARQALALVPDWHYVRDILLPKILSARAER